jgi:hypothetical protein
VLPPALSQHSLTFVTPSLTYLQSHLALLPHRNMITDGQSKVSDSEVCINDDGFGYASEGE